MTLYITALLFAILLLISHRRAVKNARASNSTIKTASRINPRGIIG